MPKLSDEDKFIDFSDYARPLATFLAYHLAKVKINAIQVTFVFFFVGLASVYCVYTNNLVWAAVFLMIKNILDAVDGEIARITQHPSIIGRYLDSVFDFIINLLILIAIYTITDASNLLLILAFLGIEFQCSVYNFYYVIVRQRLNNVESSRIIEYRKPVAYHYESQKIVNVLHAIFLGLYAIFDVFVVFLDKKAISVQDFPKWFMSLCSLLGLGFQLLLICIFLCFGLTNLILPFFAWYSIFGLFVIFIRKIFVR
jgi:phosphatidylglycerophosphate synthase